jgi:predicted XRE-type DNA-binding protein
MNGKKREKVVAGAGNVFRDLGFADSEDRKLRVQLAVRLNELIEEQRLSQAAVAKRFVFRSLRFDLRTTLSRFVRVADLASPCSTDIDIVIRPRDSAHATGHVSVLFAV